MNIRLATDKDISEIVNLLKSSLGETSSPKSEKYWRWKHVDNPFGPSPVLLAEEGGEIIGIRAFMRWQWQVGQQVFSALRAVDTATHPNHQGKGIFKKLTLALVDQCITAGDHFVFNTPNDQSRPGYLKMGWIEAGKLNVGISFYLPALFGKKQQIAAPPPAWNEDELTDLCTTWNKIQAESGQLFTPKSLAYLQWRYLHNPVQAYNCICEPGIFLATYLKKRKRFNELRTSELLLDLSDSSQQLRAKKNMAKIAQTMGTPLISYAPVAQVLGHKVFSKIAPIGPMLTLRKLSASEQDMVQIKQLSSSHFALGDLELF